MSEYTTKVCPRCGEQLFADMHVCYGCLYEFSTKGDAATASSTDAPAPEETDLAAGDTALPQLQEDEPFLWDAGLPPSEPGWEDDTLDLSGSGGESCTSAPLASKTQESHAAVLCWVRTPSVDVKLSIPKEGLVVGRDPSSDIVLHSRAVSRSHLRILSTKDNEEGMRVIDLGATNPAVFSGREVKGEVFVPLGWTVSVCGALVTPVRPKA